MPGNGWIKLHRSVLSNWVFDNDEPYDSRSAWIYLLLSANHEKNTVRLGCDLLELAPGQFITSLRKLAGAWKWKSLGKVRRFLELLISDGMIKVEWNTKRTVVTIVNWAFYQSTDLKTEHERNTNGTQTETNKKVKNDKNDKKTRRDITSIGADAQKTVRFAPPTVEEVSAYCQERNNGIDPQRFVDHYSVRNWIPKGYKTQMTDWKAAVRTWERNNVQSAPESGNVFLDMARERGAIP